MPEVIVKVEEYTQYKKIREISVNLTQEQIDKYINSRESLVFDMDNEGEGDFLNIVADKVDKDEFKQLQVNKLQEEGLLCIMRMRILKVGR